MPGHGARIKAVVTVSKIAREIGDGLTPRESSINVVTLMTGERRHLGRVILRRKTIVTIKITPTEFITAGSYKAGKYSRS